MHEHREQHQKFIREVLRQQRLEGVVYIQENAYDGGYEVRLGTHDFFIDYEAAEAGDEQYILDRIKNYVA